MSPRRLLCGSSLTVVALLALPSVAHAQDANRNWDPNGTAANGGGSGTWNTSAPTWSPNADGVSGPYTAWDNAGIDNAIFGGPSGTNATVALATPIIAHNLTFDANTTYTLTGSTLTLAGTTPTITTNGTATINSILNGNAGLTKAGAGALTLNGVNTFTGGINLTGGVLTVNGDAALGVGNNITLAAGTSLRSTGALASTRVVTLAGSASIGGGVGSAHITGAGGLQLVQSTTLSDDTNDFTGDLNANGVNLVFSSVGNIGQASALGAGSSIFIGSEIGAGSTSAVYTGDGDVSNRGWSMRNGGGGISLVNQGTGTLTLTGNFSQSGLTTVFVAFSAATADMELLGVISGFRPITFQGGGTARTITLGGANTFTAPTTIGGVTVRASTLANRGTNSSLGTGMTGTGAIAINNGILSYTGTGGGTDRALSINGSSSVLNDGTGALALSGGVAFNAAAPADSFTLGGSFAGNNTLSGVISGNGGVIMNGAAGNAWLLSGANTYSGATTVTSGTLRAGSDQAFGTPNAVTINGGTLDLNAHDIMVASLAGTGGSVALGGGGLTVNGAASTSYAGSITGNGNLVKRGTGTLTLAGQSTYTGSTTINGGTLALNFAAAGAPISDILSATSTLNMAGGTLAVTGAAGATNSQTFNGLNVTAGNNRLAATSGAGGSMTLNLGALTRTSGLLDFTLPASGAITTSNGDGALGWATVNGTDYAQVLAGNITAFASYANKDDASTWLTGDVVSDAGGAANSPYFSTVTGNVQLGGIKYTAAANSTVTVGGANTLGVDGTIIVAASIGNASQTITGGSLTGSAGGGTLGVLHNGTGTGTFTIASAIVDNGGATGFIKGGTGRVSLTGANTYTGGTTLGGGTLVVNSIANGGVASSIGASSAAASNLVIESGTLEYTGGTATTDRGFTLVNGGPSRAIQITNGAANLTFSGAVSGPDDAGLIKTGAGTLTLANAANDYTGVTTVSGGTLAVGTLANGGVASGIGASSADSANLVLQNAGGLQYTGATAATDRGFTLGTGNGRVGVSNAAAVLTVSGVATGVGGLIKEGDGTLLLSGTNLYTGGTTISAGMLRAGSVQAFGSQTSLMSVNAGGTLDLAGFANKVGALSGAGSVVLGSATLTSGGLSGTFTGTLGGSGGFYQAAGGIQTLAGCNNIYTGATSIVGGTLSVNCIANGGVASGIGASSNLSANLVLSNGHLFYSGASASTDRGFTVAGTGTISVSDPTATLQFSGAVVGAGALQKAGTGTLLLSGASSYSGGTAINGGVLRAGRINAFGTGGVSLGNVAGAALDLNNFNTTIGYLNGGGPLGGNVTLGMATLTLNTASGAANYAGAISGSGGLVKNGAYTQILSGCGSSYTGSTAINGGVLEVACLADSGTNSAIGASAANAGNLILNGGTLRYTGAGGSTDRLFTLGASAASRLEASGAGAIAFTGTAPIAFTAPGTSQTLAIGGTNIGNNSLSAQITNNGAGVTSLTKDGVGTWILNNAGSTYTGITTINGGVLGVSKLSDGGVASSIGASSAAAANLVIGNNSTLRYTGAGDTTNRLFTLSAGTTFIESSGTGAIVFTDTGLVTLAGANQARTIALGGTNGGNNTLAGSIGNSGSGITTLAKNDAGTWLLTGTNSYSGPTNINAGTLILGNGGTTGSIASATVNNLGILGFNRSDTLTYGGVITQTGSVRQLGTGTTILTGVNSYTGGTTISAGTLQLGNGGASGSITGNVANDGVLAFNRSDTITFNGVISGTGSVRQAGAGTTILTGINSYAGGTAIDAGTLQVSSDANLGAAAGPLSFNNGILRTTANITSARAATLTGAGTMLTDAGTSFTLSGVVSGAGGLTKAGAGTLTLTGTNNYAGGTTIAGGTLSLGNGGTTGSILGDVTNNGALVFDRSDNIGFGGLVSGTGSVTQRGTGIVTLTANNNYTGVTNVNAGTLLINGNQSAATGLASVASGATLGGSGIIGGSVNVANGGILAPGNSPGTMTINGNLSLASGSILNFEFGQADVVGGPLNDLVNVGGNLVLDGTINVGVSAGGTFGGGIYRVFNYGGALTDNGLTLGVLPVGSSVTVQTSVAGQVNLINSLGLSLSFWDGNAGPKFNNVVNGGNGTWHLAGADNNWANADGSVNAAYADGTLAIFAGTAGTVTVDNASGAVTASGLQFASNGYLINGGPLTLIGPDSMVRVGDGTAVGAGYTATIAAVLAGTTRLVKTDLGTLVLSGANTYTGGTAINGGTLRIASDANLGAAGGGLDFNGGTLNTTTNMITGRAVTLTGAGTFLTSNVLTTLRLTGPVTGGGRLIKSGAGILLLTGDATHSGGTTITAGTLQIGAATTTGSIVGDIVNDGTLTFQRSDAYSYGGSISGTGALIQSGAGVLSLTGNSSYGGTTNVTAGELRIASGNTVSSGGTGITSAVLSIDGSGSVLSTTGLTAQTQSGSGIVATVNISNGGVLRTTAGNLVLRNAPVGPVLTSLNISGAGSLADVAGGLLVGTSISTNIAGTTISSGGALRTAGASQMGNAAGNTTAPFVTITGAGSNWTSTSTLAMTNGTFSLLSGGAASFAGATIGSVSAARPATVLVSGTNSSFTTTGNLAVGSGVGTGVVTLADGGLLNVGGSLAVADNAGATGVLNIGGGESLSAAAAGTLTAASVSLGSATSRVNFNHNDPAYGFAALISGTGNVNQVAGTTVLTGTNSYTGATNVSGGTLIVNGDQTAATGLTTVAAAGTLGGKGTIGGNVIVSGGTINPGDIGIAPGALTINGNLNIAAGSTLNLNLGQANVVGGALNDLVNVGGNLVLDGTLDVQTSVGGSFDPGIYRIINYAGALTDNGLTIGTIPALGYYVQTSVANQVNLVNTSGLQFRYWDGTGPKNDGVVDGGDGLWQRFNGNDNWVDDGSIPNAPFADSAFAVFQGAAGTVTVDESLGAVNVAGMQFLTDGYAIDGDAVTLTGAQATIRVGDGTAAGAATTATIAAELTGTAQLVKADLGTLLLTGTNSYTGGTAINAGVLRISADANLGDAAGGLTFNGGTLETTADFDSGRAVALAGNGSLLTGTGTTLGLTGGITGAGNLVKVGAGTLVLTGANSYSGDTQVNAGTLFVNGNQSAANGLTGVASGAVLGGTGVIGGNVSIADGGTLDPGGVDGSPGRLTINGNLALAANATLSMQFGEANVAGGAHNDLIDVGGNVTLDGALNVSLSAGGSFGPGIYRVFNYGGALTDNGLTLGTMPGGSEVSLQTAISGQVNLVNSAGLTLSFWDGNPGPKNNGQIDGGNGVWRIGGGSNNWTDSAGALNADYTPDSFAIFSAAPGTVSIDNGSGNVGASGMQFASNGYVITGDALTLTGAQALVQVGDGSAGGAGYTATIDAALTGSAGLVKTDLGTLVLTGTNDYTGGTAINGGTMRIASDTNLGAAAGGLSLNGGTLNTTASLSSARAIGLVGTGTFLSDTGTTLTLSGTVSGTGGLTKSGTGALVLSGIGTYGGATNVAAGTLLVNGNYTGATGAIVVASGAGLGGTGTIGGNVTLANGALLTPGAGGAGTLTIGGDLSLAAGTTLAWEFGQANVAGGALNDLVDVGGNLTLDGTINVTVPAGGAFGTGIYRVFNYGGTLTDNGLTLGTLAGGNVAVQTSIAGQVNLVNSAGLSLAFWDGAAGPKNNGAINGGAGIWQNGSGNDNWTDATGAVNAGYSDGAFAVFGGAGSTVTVDGSLGQVTAAGMQFAATGYTIAGNAVALTGPQSTIRVGDGSAAGAGFTATINSVLSGDTRLLKTDAGTLVLGGTNSYTGGTSINGGTVRISADANLGAVAGNVTLDGGTLATSANVTSARGIVMAGAGTIATANGTTFAFNGLLSGTGALTNTGAGTLLLTGNNAGFAGSTRVEGTMIVNGSLCGDVNVAVGGRLGGTGTVCTTVNAGTIAPGNSIGTLTVAGTYTGSGGVLEIETALGGDASPTDRLVVTSGTAGATEIVVINRGGLGAQTTEGIKIVDVTGGASTGTFTLRSDYNFEGRPTVVAGAFGYRLFQGGVSTPTDGDWYLRSALLDAPNAPQVPLYQPGVPLYENYAAALQTLNRLGTLQERVGNRQWSGFTQGGVGMWGRVEGARYRPQAAFSTSASDLDADTWTIQAGLDKGLLDSTEGTLIAGVNARYGKVDAQVRSRFGNGTIDTEGYGLGATLTWYSNTGFYADAQAQVNWYRTDLKSGLLGKLADNNRGSGEAFSIEVGKRASLGGGFSITPQIQVAYSNVRFDRFVDPAGAVVSSDSAGGLRTRWGISVDHQKTWESTNGAKQRHLYGIFNLTYEWLGGTAADVSGTRIVRQDDRLWGEVGLGGSYSWADGRYTLYMEASANTAINNFGDSNGLKGNAGFRMRF